MDCVQTDGINPDNLLPIKVVQKLGGQSILTRKHDRKRYNELMKPKTFNMEYTYVRSFPCHNSRHFSRFRMSNGCIRRRKSRICPRHTHFLMMFSQLFIFLSFEALHDCCGIRQKAFVRLKFWQRQCQQFSAVLIQGKNLQCLNRSGVVLRIKQFLHFSKKCFTLNHVKFRRSTELNC